MTCLRNASFLLGCLMASATASPRAIRESRPAALSFTRDVVSKRKGLKLRLEIEGAPIAGQPLIFRVKCMERQCADIEGDSQRGEGRRVTAQVDLEMPEHAHGTAMPYTVGQEKGRAGTKDFADTVTFAGPVALHMPGWWRVTVLWLERDANPNSAAYRSSAALIDAAVFDVDVEP